MSHEFIFVFIRYFIGVILPKKSSHFQGEGGWEGLSIEGGFKPSAHLCVTLSNISNDLSELRNDFKKIELELSVSKNVNSKLQERVVVLEIQCWRRECEYSRRECLEITAVPDSISNDDMEETTIKIFETLDVTIGPSYTEDCHWLKSNGPKKVIIKFARRKNANNIRKTK